MKKKTIRTNKTALADELAEIAEQEDNAKDHGTRDRSTKLEAEEARKAEQVRHPSPIPTPQPL